MIVSSFFWGFLTDNASRKPFFILGLLADVCCNILSTTVDSYQFFFLIKFITGTIVSGPFALLVPYLAEFQPLSRRAKFVGWTGFIYGFGNIIPAFIGAIVLPMASLSFTVFDHSFNVWRIYILICTTPAILGLVTMSFLPESPKQLMNNGQTEEALELMRKMYAMNTGNPRETFPIKSIVADTKSMMDRNKSNFEKIRDSWIDFKTLTQSPYLGTFFVISFLQFGSMLGFNTMRLWVPHMFMIINNFDYTLWDWSRGMPTMCEMLIPGVVPPGLDDPTIYANITDTCIRWRINPIIYVNSTIIAASAVGFSFFIVRQLDTRIKKKAILLAGFVIGTISGFGANWAQLVPIILCLCSSIAVVSRITGNIVIAINATVIPAQLRATSTSFVTMIGSLGTVVGNLIWSTLLGLDCVVALMWIGSSLLLCVFVALFALKPPTELPEPEPDEPKMVTRF
ncbi:synaptic vesicle glycoprotein 2C-like isoform X2 [Venturia canescens]|nr:synaptic vesicle glycoprotein 2C-like isoform X2 [Venturia canescens]